MLLNDDEIKERVESPLNLLNRLRSNLNKTITNNIPSMPPKAEDVIADLEDKISTSTTKSKALGIMSAAMDELKNRMGEVQKPEKLAQIAREMAQVVSHHESRDNGNDSGSRIIVYAPQVISLENYNIVDVVE